MPSTDPVEAPPWEPLWSACCKARSVYYYEPANRFIVYYPWHGPVDRLYCGNCNSVIEVAHAD